MSLIPDQIWSCADEWWVKHLFGMYLHDELRMLRLCTGTDTKINKPTSFDAMLTVGNNELTYSSQLCKLYSIKNQN